MGKREEALIELYKRGELTPKQRAAVEELGRRGKLELGEETTAPFTVGKILEERHGAREQAMKEVAEEVGPLQSFLIGAGKGLYDIGRGIGITDPASEEEREGIAALKEKRPYTSGAGEIVGQAAPFLIPGTAAGRLASWPLRVAAEGVIGGAEGAIISKAEGKDVLSGAGIGAGVGMGAEILFPVLGRLGRKVYQRVRGKVPVGSMLDEFGLPTQELQGALDEAGILFSDLKEDAMELIKRQPPGAKAEEVARAARFAEEGIPATKGEITQRFPQRVTEERLLGSPGDVAAEPFRQYKLRQSEAIKKNLQDNMGFDVDKEETGSLIKGALEGRFKLLSTQKRELYEEGRNRAKDIGGLPIFTDGISEVVPDADTFEDLAITAPQAIKSLDQILTKYGIKEPTQEAVDAGFEPTLLTVENFERFRKTLNAIARGDQTGAANVAIVPIKEALDKELGELSFVLKDVDLPEGMGAELEAISGIFKRARRKVQVLKTEFSPQAIVGKIIDTKKDGVTQVIESSKIYDKLVAKSLPVEDARKAIKSLARSGQKGKQAMASIQASTILDLIDAGFGTESRKIEGIKIFNPIAFKKRLATIGKDKIKAIFGNRPNAYKKFENIEKIATDLVPPEKATPKGSADVVLDLADKLLDVGISTKIPGWTLFRGALRKITDPIKTGRIVKEAISGDPDVLKLAGFLDSTFPGIAAALGIASILKGEEE